MYEATENLIPKLHKLYDWVGAVEPLEDSDEETFFESVEQILTELWELSILFRKIKNKS